ncbi:MAG: MFS transporter [Planctomycetaceae bacterium]|nr:MFS transporter [Planctomycetaceae bacterium]
MTSDLSPRSTSNVWVWWVCFVLLLASALNYMDRQTLSNVAPRILVEFQMDERQYGNLEWAFGWAFAAGALFFGILADKINIRWLYPAVLLAWSVMGFATGLVETYENLLLCRLLLGFFEAGHWPCALKTTQRLLPVDRRTLGNSVLQSGTAIGAILTPQIIKLMLTDEPGSWRPAFQWIGAIGIGWVVLWLLTIRGNELSPKSAPTRDTSGDVNADRSFWDSVLSREFLVLVGVVIFINTGWHLFRAWFPLFLNKARGYSENAMLDFNFAFHIATDVGCLSAGFATAWLYQKGGLSPLLARKIVFTVCAVAAGLAGLLPWIPNGPVLVGVMLVVGMGLLGLFPCYYAFSQELTMRHQGKVTGTLGTIAWLTTSPLHPIFGEYVKRTQAYDQALGLAAVMPLLGAGLLWAFWPKPQPTSTP